MIKDSDRAMQYSKAIEEALKSLKLSGVTNVLVLDFGAGTGLLSGLVHKIANLPHIQVPVHTVLVDCNKDMLEFARVLLTEQGLQENMAYSQNGSTFIQDFTIHHGSCSRLRRQTNVFNKKVDFAVSEILGTFGGSESVVEYFFNNVIPLVRVIGGKKHAIPSKIEQYASLYTDSLFVPQYNMQSHSNLSNIVDEIVMAHSQLTTRCKSPEGRLSVQTHPLPKRHILPLKRVSIYSVECRFDGSLATKEPNTKNVFGEVSVSSSTILAFEWKAWLFNGVVLSNTVKHANDFRQGAWGIPYAYLVPHAITKTISGHCHISWPKSSIQPTGVKMVPLSKEDKTLMKKNQSEEILSSDEEDNDDDSDYEESKKSKKKRTRK